MHTNKLYPALLLLLVISLVFSACSAAATTAAAPTRTLSAAPTATAASTRTQTATPEPSATWTQSPSPTVSPMPSLTPTSAPLSADGPWLLLAMDYSNPDTTADYLVMNGDGSGLQPVSLPAVPGRSWSYLWRPGGPFLAFRTFSIEGPSIDIKADGLDDYVWIIKLPENRVIRKLPLLSEAAWQVINETRASHLDYFSERFNLPTQLGLVFTDSFKWSPSGRYLAYSAALDGQGMDLYLYDTMKDTTRRLTTGRAGAQVWFWSPDESTIFYRNGTSVAIGQDGLAVLSNLDGVYAIDLTLGSERKLYQPPLSDETIWYTSDHDFIVSNSGHETDYSNLRRVNYKTGAISTLFEGHFTAIGVADGQTILFSLDPTHGFSGVPESTTPGLYRLNLTTGQPDLIRGGHFWWIHYKTSLHLFDVEEDVNGSSLDIVLLDHAGQEKLRLPHTYWVEPSPDGRWINVRSGNTWKVYNLSGEAQTEEFSGDTFWLNDSSGFFTNDYDAGIQFYPQAIAWQPVTVYRGQWRSFYLLQKP